MSHLYNQDRRVRQEQQQRHNHGASTNNNAALFRMSKRDVFSNEECDESVGYPYARDVEDHDMFRSMDLSDSQRGRSSHHREGSTSFRGVSLHYGDNIDEHHDSLHAPSFHSQHPLQQQPTTPAANSNLDDLISMSDAETVLASSSNHTRPSIADTTAASSAFKSSIATEDQHHRQWMKRRPSLRPPSQLHVQLEQSSEMQPSHPPRSTTHTSTSNITEEEGEGQQRHQSPAVVDLDLEEFPDFEERVLNGDLTQQEAKKHRQKMIGLATMALVLILLVAAGTITWWVLGWRKDEQTTATASDHDNTTPQPNSPTQQPTVPPRKTIQNLDQWAQQFLPPTTLQSILQHQSTNATTTPESSPAVQAFEWIQTDPYFIDNNTSSSTQEITTLTAEQLTTKRLNRFGLATIYYATGGPWNMNTGAWLSPQDECQWPYYTCPQEEEPEQLKFEAREEGITRRQLQQSTQGGGARLHLRNVPIKGSLPPEISLLSHLSALAIYEENPPLDSSTGLTGSLPTQLGVLTHLTLLDLHNHRMTGIIPTELAQLTNLQRLHLHKNSFANNTSVPSELCNIAGLTELTVDCNTVKCPCSSCTCPTGSNIFDHSTTTTTTAPPTTTIPIVAVTTNLPVSTGPLTTTAMPTPAPTTPAPSPPLNTNPPTPTLAPIAVTFAPTFAATPQPTPSSLEIITVSASLPPTSPQTTTNDSATIDDNSTSDLLLYSNDTTMRCNGLANICNLPLPQVLTPMVHNAMATHADGFLVANHLLGMEQALAAGFRGFSLKVCLCEGQLVFCHSLCPLGSQPIPPILQALLDFLLDHPHEVLVLNFELSEEPDGPPINMTQFYQLLEDTGNLTEYLYQHNATDNPSWPTLKSLIDTEKRVVMFHFNGPTCDQPEDCPPGMHYYFDYAADTEWEFPEIDNLLNTSMSCQITRGSAGQHRAFLGINNFLSVPQPEWAPTLNALEFVQSRVDACSQANAGWNVSFLYVDHWSVGDVLEFAQEYNQQLTPPSHSPTEGATRTESCVANGQQCNPNSPSDQCCPGLSCVLCPGERCRCT